MATKKVSPKVKKAGKTVPATRKATAKKEKPIGKVTHYFSKIGVAIVKLSASLKEGDSIRIEGGNTVFSQTVDSIEQDHQKIAVAKKGSEIGIKVKQKARVGPRCWRMR